MIWRIHHLIRVARVIRRLHKREGLVPAYRALVREISQ